jgi:hypothetical protein
MAVGRTGRVMITALVAAIAFGGGMALHAWGGDDSGAAPAAAVTRLAGDPPARPIRLVRADPGRLRRPPERRPQPATQPAAPVPSAVAPAPAPAPAPAAPAPAPPTPAPTVQPQGFDLRDQPPAPDTFDSDG